MDTHKIESSQQQARVDVASPTSSSLSTSKPDDPCHDYDRDVAFVPYDWSDDEQGHYAEQGTVWVPAI